MTRWVIGFTIVGFDAFLVWASWVGFAGATIAFIALSIVNLLGVACLLSEKKEPPRKRKGLPAVSSFPLGVSVAAAAILLGGWMTVAGIVMIVCEVCELTVLAD